LTVLRSCNHYDSVDRSAPQVVHACARLHGFGANKACQNVVLTCAVEADDADAVAAAIDTL
jgi:uncharacterized protein (DUF2147 family)